MFFAAPAAAAVTLARSALTKPPENFSPDRKACCSGSRNQFDLAKGIGRILDRAGNALIALAPDPRAN